MMMERMPEATGSEILLQENQKLRVALQEARREKQEAHREMRKLQGDLKGLEFKLENYQNQKQRLLGDNRRFMDIYQSEKQEKIRYLTQASEARSLASRCEAQLNSVKNRADNLSSQCNRLKSQLEISKKKEVEALKERQNTVNTIRILETKLQAAQMQKKYNITKVEQLQSERKTIAQELKVMTKKYHEKQIGAEAIIRDQEQTKQKLLGQFQRKISIKDQEIKEQMQAYINENTLLKQQIIALERIKI